MIINRRSLIAAGGAATVAACAERGFQGFAAGETVIAVYDGRLAGAGDFLASRAARASIVLDIAAEPANHWRKMRSLARRRGRVIGYTSWSDWVALRGLLNEHGKRMRQEERHPVAVSGVVSAKPATPFLWVMA